LWKLKSSPKTKKTNVSPHNSLSEKSAWKSLQNSIKTNDLIKTRQALHDWTQTLSADNKKQSINQLADYLNNKDEQTKLSTTITELESCLYKEENAFDSNALLEQLQNLRKQRQSTNASSNVKNDLEPLYKN